MRHLFWLLAILLSISGCDSSGSDPNDVTPPSGPSGSFAIDPVWFELHVVADPGQGFYANYQGWIEGSLTLQEQDGVLSGSGRCTWTKRLHRSWLGETSTSTETQTFTARGTLNGSRVTLDLQGCAWAMTRHTGTFENNVYSLRIPDLLSGPLFAPDVWDGAVPLNNSDPFKLTLSRP